MLRLMNLRAKIFPVIFLFNLNLIELPAQPIFPINEVNIDYNRPLIDGPISIDYNVLLNNKNLYQSKNDKLVRSVQGLIKLVESSMDEEVGSVVEKRLIGGIKDIHNYVSMGPYWWPDPKKEDGLPYIRKDGQTNPEVRDISDKTYLNRLSTTIELLGLAYFYTEDEKYSSEAIRRLKVWFVNSETKMNPNLDNGQFIPGRHDGRPEGIIDTRVLVPILNGIQLIKKSPSWDQEIDNEINKWFSDFLDWLLYSPIGKSASNLKNNIGTAYQLQVVGIGVFLGNKGIVLNSYKNKIPQLLDQQFDTNGVQLLELKRADSWSYSIMNLSYWFSLAQMFENSNLDLWNFETSNRRSLRSTFDWMLTYAMNEKKWEYPQRRNVDYNGSFSRLYQMSKGKFNNDIKILGIPIFRISSSYEDYETIERISNKPLDIIIRQN
jgi:hypothetical protein